MIDGSHPWIKFSKDDSPLMDPKFEEEKFPEFGGFLGVPASPEIGTDAAQIAPRNLDTRQIKINQTPWRRGFGQP